MATITVAPSMEKLRNVGYSEYHHLKPYIKHWFDYGLNEWGLPERMIILEDGSCWDYIPEDGLWEYNENKVAPVIR